MHVVAESVSPTELARRIDHSLLRPEATAADIARLCDQAVQWRFYAVCVNPIFVSLAARHLQRQPVRICSVAGFPLGAEPLATKIDQARRAIDDGADEIDMVVHLAALISGDADALRREISAVAELVHSASPQHVLKVILETAALDRQQMRLGCQCARQAGADFVKTSSGFHPAGGAT
ncbi:MAG: deoxyribose-phosphate aldolase, partial [Phycisphaerae bacterium]